MRPLSLTLLVCLMAMIPSATFCMASLTDGLVAYWPLDGDTKDAIGGHDGVLKSGSILIDDPERDKVLDVSPNNGTAFMEVAHADDIGFVDPASRTFTISLWAKPANLPRAGWTTVFAKNRLLRNSCEAQTLTQQGSIPSPSSEASPPSLGQTSTF